MPRKTLEIAGALVDRPADKRVEILRRVGASGSISQAARDAGVSYKAAWQALDTLSNLAGAVLVERVVGGAGGGGARLTPAGEQVLQAADELARARHAVLDRLAERTALPPRVAALGLRTSMRNQLPCRIASLRARAGAVEVALDLPGGGRLVSRITRESAQLLELARGQEVLALCKATAVAVRAERPEQGANVLPGTVARAPRGGAAGEVALTLAGGLQLVGFVEAGSGLRTDATAFAHMDPAAVVIALGA
ncbi:MAG: TOBE domain-containing protein [Burkholderiales bacterium]|nr:TOBE domain-containing protein [Burkholderiales bacterium]